MRSAHLPLTHAPYFRRVGGPPHVVRLQGRFPARRPNTLLRLALPVLISAVGCSVPIAGPLDDTEADRIVVALDRSSVDATKEPDPTVEGRWRILVGREEVPRALAIMREEELPRAVPPSLLDAIGKGSLVPSEAAEHAQLVAGLAGELERSLQGIEGVIRVRVHLNVPAPNTLRDTILAHGSAAVLLEHRGSTPPLSAESVQRLVAGAVSGLVPSEVAVVMVSRPAPAGAAASAAVGHLGPIVVARASLRPLQAALVGLVALVALLAAATAVLRARLSRAQAELLLQQQQRAAPNR
jgi:type III secretion system YscJ/HrcJ family lipoprotein